MPSFTITVPDIHQGPGYVWYNVPGPAAASGPPVVSPRRGFAAPGKFMVACLYNSYAKDPFQIGFTRTKEAVYKVRFEGLAVLSRSQGDRVAQFYRQV